MRCKLWLHVNIFIYLNSFRVCNLAFNCWLWESIPLADVIPKRTTPLPPTYPEFPEPESISIDTRRPLAETPRSMQASKQRIECFAKNCLKKVFVSCLFAWNTTWCDTNCEQVNVNILFGFQFWRTRRGLSDRQKSNFYFLFCSK